MKSLLILLVFSFVCESSIAQENPVIPGSDIEQQLENLAEQQDAEPEDDSFLQTLVQLRKNKINLNSIDENGWKELRLLSALQINSFLKYRQLLGPFISMYELQAVPGWDISTIRKLLPYIFVGNTLPLSANLRERVAGGDHSIIIRMQQTVEKSNGFTRADSEAIRYPGSEQRIFFRYKYNFRNLLQFGITGDKDAGEQFFKGSQKQGFDFYSVHLFARKMGIVKSLAIGDFTVNLGQGLIQWQSLAFKKSADITAIKRQADVLRPYNSAGEYNFMRGAGLTIGIKNFDFTAFASTHRLDASINSDTIQTNDDFISSILNSGYHRTATEVAKKNAMTQTAVGGNFSFTKNNLHIGFNAVGFKFSIPINRQLYPYNLFAIAGSSWSNYSFDYGYTYRNFHFFGEGAMDRNNAKALVAGALASLDPKVDASFVYRSISYKYQSLYGNAFTEGTFPSNENGFFTGICVKPASSIKIDVYADVFSFPWLRYRVDKPTKGSEYLLQASYQPNKQLQLYTRFKSEKKPSNVSGTDLPFRPVVYMPKYNWRTNVSYTFSRRFSLFQRAEVVWFDPKEKAGKQQGFLLFVEGKFKANHLPLSTSGRLQYFETDGFDSRLYAFESDVLYSYSIPVFIGKGLRYYLNLNYDFSKKITAWFRWAQTIYANRNSIGSGLDEIKGNKKSEIKMQIQFNF